MTVGQQVTVRGKEKARPAAQHATAIARARTCRRAALDFDEGYRRRHALQRADHCAGVGIEQLLIVRSTAGVGGPLRRQHVQLRMIFGCAESPSTMSRFTRRTKIAGSSSSP